MDRTTNIDTSSTTNNTNQFEIQSEEPNNKTLTMRKSSTPLNGSCLDGNVQHIQQQSQSHQQQHDEDSLFFVNKGKNSISIYVYICIYLNYYFVAWCWWCAV